MVVLVSTTFIVLNVPFFVAWCSNYIRFLQRTPIGDTRLQLRLPEDLTAPDRTRGWMYITRTIFFGNYCINFFIYSLSGAYFRQYLRHCFFCRLGDIEDGTTTTCRPIKYGDYTSQRKVRCI